MDYNRLESNVGVMLSEFANPNIIRIFKASGFQFVIVDNEHGYFDYSQLAAMAAVANGFHMPLIVRVPGVGREYITKVLDMGADGILVPMVESAGQAKEIVSYAKYAPIGKRGVSTTRPHTDYSPPALSEYFEIANKRVSVFVQLETEAAIEHVEEIACITGIDALFIGPNDLACDLGIPGEVSSPKVLEKVDIVAEAGKKFKKPTGIITTNKELIKHCQEQKYTFYSYGSEADLLLKGGKSRVSEFRQM